MINIPQIIQCSSFSNLKQKQGIKRTPQRLVSQQQLEQATEGRRGLVATCQHMLALPKLLPPSHIPQSNCFAHYSLLRCKINNNCWGQLSLKTKLKKYLGIWILKTSRCKQPSDILLVRKEYLNMQYLIPPERWHTHYNTTRFTTICSEFISRFLSNSYLIIKFSGNIQMSLTTNNSFFKVPKYL